MPVRTCWYVAHSLVLLIGWSFTFYVLVEFYGNYVVVFEFQVIFSWYHTSLGSVMHGATHSTAARVPTANANDVLVSARELASRSSFRHLNEKAQTRNTIYIHVISQVQYSTPIMVQTRTSGYSLCAALLLYGNIIRAAASTKHRVLTAAVYYYLEYTWYTAVS